MYKEHLDPKGRKHREAGPAVESATMKQWYFDGKRHRTDGPAVESVNGTALYYWRGVLVPKHVVMEPRKTDPKTIVTHENVEVRRAWIEAYGYEEFIKTIKPTVLDDDKELGAVLYKIPIPNDEDLILVKVKDASTDRIYFLRVPQNMRTAKAAVAWTFNMDEKEYAPVKEA